MLEERILEFSRLLRQGGINVSLTQITAALESVALIGLTRDDFHSALLSTLVTDQMDQPLFDKLFRLYFLILSKRYQQVHAQNSGEVDEVYTSPKLVQSIDGKGIGRGGGATPYILLVKAVRESNYPLLRRLGEMAVTNLIPLEQDAVKDLDNLVDQAKVSLGWYQAVNTLERLRLQERVSEGSYSRWMDNISFLEGYIESLLEDLLVKAYGIDVLEELAVAANLREREFYQLDKIEVQEIRKRITKLARKLATKYARRYRRAKHGKIDLRRTVKEAMVTGGTPVRLKYRKRVISKPELVLLCDVSGSVALFSGFMLQLVYTIQKRFSQVRSFLFVNTIDEVTEYFKNNDIEEALEQSFAKARYAMSPFSNYGKVFRDFERKFLSDISPRSTLIILGDARNNYNHDEKEFLQRIQEHVRRILWFNPQPRGDWNREDSIINIYARNCRQVFECRNLNQLEDVIEAIL